MKQTMIQYFEWYLPNDGTHWKKVSREAASLAKTGITSAWLPPASKGASGRDEVGYAVYDLYDLGEFRQKGTIRTKYGTKTQYIKAINDLKRKGIMPIADIVFNHRMGADGREKVTAIQVDPMHREIEIGQEKDVRVWTSYTFPKRRNKYSDFKWNWHHFTGTDYTKDGNHEILLFQGKHWNNNVSKECGNFDYVMGQDVDFSSPEVLKELYDWGKWFCTTTQISGFRLDAVKSIDSHFFPEWLKAMHKVGNHPNFAFGEYWSGSVWDLKGYLNQCNYSMSLLDVPLHFHLQQASQSNGNYDIRNLFAYTLTETDPHYSIAFVDNHDTQPTQALESWVLDWFKPHAYATILLNICEYPCVFYGDYYGIPQAGKGPVPFLRQMIWIRANILSDNILSLFDEDPQKACWLAYGDHPVVVLYTIGDWKQKDFCEPNYANMTLVDITDENNTATFDENGWAHFTCKAGGCSVYILPSDIKKMKSDLHLF